MPLLYPMFKYVAIIWLELEPACSNRVGPQDLNRQVVKSDSSTIFFPDVDLEIPPESQQVRRRASCRAHGTLLFRFLLGNAQYCGRHTEADYLRAF